MADRGGASVAAFHHMVDESVVALAKKGSREAAEHLLRKYRHLVEGKAQAYFLMGADRDDVLQEGMIGLYKAIRDFSHRGRLSAFRTFAELCVTRQIITAVKTATRQKHWLLNSCVSIDAPVEDDGGERPLQDVLCSRRPTEPERVVLGRQLRDEVNWRIRDQLSDLEASALLRYIEGKSYHEIAADLRKGVKQIDNALQRAKKKIGRTLQAASLA